MDTKTKSIFAEQADDDEAFELARYRAIAELASGSMHEYRITPDGRFLLEWVVGAERIFGVSDQELQKRGSDSFLAPEDLAASQAREQAYRRDERVEFSTRIYRPDGEFRQIKVVNQPKLDAETGELIGLTGFCTDVTDQYHAARALEESEFRHRTVVELSPGFVCEGRIDARGELQFTWASPSAKEFFGCGVDEFNRLGWQQFTPPEFVPTIVERIKRTRAGQVTTDELPVFNSRGELHWLEMKVRPLAQDADHTLSFVAMTQDITRKRANEELLRSQAFAFANMSEGVVLTTFHGEIRLTNPAAEAFFGVSAEELVGKCLSELPTNPPMVLTKEELKFAVNQFSQPIRRQLRVTAARGNIRNLEMTLTPLTLHDERFWLAVMQDVTERQSLEREILEVSNREQQRIGSDLHDGLGQELTGVALLLRGLASKADQRAPELSAPIEELARLVNDAIFTTRTLARGLTPITFDRGGLANALADLAKRSQATYNVHVRCTADAALQRRIPDSVAMHLYRMAQEAIANAARHAKAHRIDISLAMVSGRGQLVIEDDGDGIGNTPQRERNGEGMGLRIMQYRATMVDGVLDISNDPRGGTRIVCDFPLSAP